MVLAELGEQISNALKKLNQASKIDDKLLDEILKEIGNALLCSDVNIKYVMDLRKTVNTKIKEKLITEDANAASNLKRQILKIVVDELTHMLGSENKPYEFVRGKPNVVMFVGLQGSGKTTTCTKFAYHYMKRGFRVGLVCADTFRAGAFEQLMMNAAKIKCPFFGHKNEKDPVKIAEEGVNFFKEKKFEIIIVDTSGRHKQEASLFNEMLQVEATIKPDTSIFVMDGSIGQACYGQAKAFHDSIKVGQVIVTKLDGHAKGGGALSAVAATKSPIIFIGVGEHFDDLEQFEAASFIKRLLGLGDLEGLMAKVQEQMSGKKQQKMLENLKEGKFTLRDMRDQFMQVMSMGSIGQLASMIPGLNSNLITKDKEKESAAKIQRFITAMDSMTKEELDCVKPLDDARIRRISRGSGVHPAEIQFLLMQHKQMSQVVKQVGSLANLGGGNLQQQMKRNPQAALQNMRKNLDPNLVNQMGGPGGIMEMAKNLQASGGGMPDMGQAMKALQGMMGGGGRGMPDMSKMMEMVQKMSGGGGMPGMPPGMGGGGAGGDGMMDPMAMM